MKQMFVLAFLVLVASVSFAEIDCPLSYNDNLTIRVLDAQMRPMPGAAVTVYYQLDETTSKGYTTTPSYYTNNAGEAKVLIHNIEVNPTNLDCEFTIYADYDGKHAESSYTATKHPSILDLQLDTYILTIKIVGQYGQSLVGAEVWMNSINRTTNKNGQVSAHVGTGKVNILVKYEDGKITDIIDITNDTKKTIGLQLYPMTLRIMDDNGNPLQATAIIGVKNATTNENGSIMAEKLASATPYVLVTYKNIEKEIEVDLTLQTKYDVIFDFTSPSIGEIKTIVSDKTTKLVIPAFDSGLYASGIDINGIIVKYKKSAEDQWHDISVYLSGKDIYVAEIPAQPIDTILRFFVEAKDKDGNSKTVEGEFLSYAQQQPQDDNGTNATANNTMNLTGNDGNATNGTNVTNQNQPDGSNQNTGGIPLIQIVGGFIILAVVIYALYRYKFSGE